jgi:DeoR family transcriptional regulator, fructose operon transcriptional repressor
MLPTERRLAIVDEIRRQPMVRADELARRFEVSVETVRRDLRALQRDGVLDLVYGGATRARHRSAEGSFLQRSGSHLERKKAIARLAAELIEPGETIVLDVGTTALEVARALPETWRGRVLTCSVPVAVELGERPRTEVLLSGGRVREGDLALSGSHAQAFFADYYADRAFLGSGGVHPEAGLTDYHPDEVDARRVVVENAERSYVLADSSKLGVIAVRKVCDLDRITAVLTDGEENYDAAEALRAAGVEIVEPVREAGPPLRLPRPTTVAIRKEQST